VILLFMSLTTPKLATQFFRQLLAANPSRAQLYLALACVAERPSLDPETEAKLRGFFESGAIVPPKDKAERDILVGVGHMSAPYLGWHESYEKYEAAYCVQALGQIGGAVAYYQLKSYAHDRQQPLLEVWDKFDRVQFAKEILAVNLAGETELWYMYVPCLDGIEQLTWLTTVKLGGIPSPLTDLIPLKYLPQLQSLMLANLQQVSDLGVLQELPQLRSLMLLDMSQVSDLNVLRELPQLQWLELSGLPQVNDFSPLLDIPMLQLVRFVAGDMPQAESWCDSLPWPDVRFNVHFRD